MILKKKEKSESRRQMLYDLSKKQELSDITNDVLCEIKDLKSLFEQYNSSNFNLTTQQILGDDPLMKGKKLMLLLAHHWQDDHKERMRQKLIEIYTYGQVFPQIIDYLILEKNCIKLKYNYDLETELMKYPLSRQAAEMKYEKILISDDQTLILNHLTRLNQVIEKQYALKELFSSEQDQATIKSLYDNSQQMKIKNPSKLIINIIENLQQLYEHSLSQTAKKKPNTEKITHLIFKILLQLLLSKNVIIPELLKILKLIRGSKIYNVSYTLGMIVFKPSVKLLAQLSNNSKISKEAKLLQLSQYSLSNNLPKYKSFFQLVEIHFPQLLQCTQDQVIEQYLELLTKTWRIHLLTLQSIFQDPQVQQLLEMTDKICGDQIKFILNHYEEAEEEFNEYGSNLLRIGTMLFRLQNLIQQRDLGSEKQSKEFSRLKLEIILRSFLSCLTKKSQPFPYLLNFVIFKNEFLEIIVSEQGEQQLLKNENFSNYLKKYDQQNGEESSFNNMNDSEIIKQQVQLLYFNKDILIEELKSQAKVCESLVKDLRDSNSKLKENLVKILVFIQYQVLI